MNKVLWQPRFRVGLTFGLIVIGLLASCGRAKDRQDSSGSLRGLASVKGTVVSSSRFKAAKVYFRTPGRRMLYMVYTDAGKFKAVNLMPGRYEAYAQAEGLESDTKGIELQAGKTATVDLSLHKTPVASSTVQLVPYAQIYPKGAGRQISERLCIRCHGLNFLPSHHWNVSQWNSAINFMLGNGNPQGAMIQPKQLTKQQRKVLLRFLVTNFGPNSKPRAVKFEKEMPLDESKLSKAEFIEYYFPIDGPGVGVNAKKYASFPRGFFGKRRVDEDLVFDQHGNVWATDRGIPNRIVRINPLTDKTESFVTPAPTKGVHDLMIDNDGMIWVPEVLGPNVDVFDTKTLKWVASYPMDPDHAIRGLKHAQCVVIDSKHNVYMNFIVGNGMSRLDWKTKKVTVSFLPTRNSFPYGIVKDTHDNIWIAEFHGAKIARLDAKTHKYTEYTPPTYPALIRRLTVDTKGRVWFGLFSAGKMDRLDVKTGKITEWSIPWENAEPYDVKQAIGSGKMWFTDGGQGGALVLFDPSSGTFTPYPTPQRTDMPKIRIANDGSIWYVPRAAKHAGVGVLYPDMTKMTSLAAYGKNN